MRDPARIDPLLNLLRCIMHAHPDLRLGQIISIVADEPFYIEDDVLMARLRERFELAEPVKPAPKRRNCWTCRHNRADGLCDVSETHETPVDTDRWISRNIAPSQFMPVHTADSCPGYEETP